MNQVDKLLLSEKEAAELLSMSTHFLRRDRISDSSIGIPFVRVGAAVRYRRTDLESWIEQQATKTKQAPDSILPVLDAPSVRRRGRPTKAAQIALRLSHPENSKI